MRIAIVAPVDADSTRGNGVTARRWQALLADLGHEVHLQRQPAVDDAYELLVALHARKSAAAIASFVARHPGCPIVLAMTGTDLYRDLPDNVEARASVAAAGRLVLLQPAGVHRLPVEAREKARVILQSVPPRPAPLRAVAPDGFAVCVLAHLREVKDPLCAARAARLLPVDSKIAVTLAGGAAAPVWVEHAEAEAAANERFTWSGELSAAAADALLSASRVVVISSRMEGGANVLSEAIIRGVPVLATRIEGNVGLLGEEYPGYFQVGDDAALAHLLYRVETDAGFEAELTQQVTDLQPMFAPARERESWAELLSELAYP